MLDPGRPLLPGADHSIAGEEACQRLCVQLASGYGPVVVEVGRARDVRAAQDVCILQMGRLQGALNNGLIGVEPLDSRQEGLDEAGLHVVWARRLAVVLVQRGRQVMHSGLLDPP